MGISQYCGLLVSSLAGSLYILNALCTYVKIFLTVIVKELFQEARSDIYCRIGYWKISSKFNIPLRTIRAIIQKLDLRGLTMIFLEQVIVIN